MFINEDIRDFLKPKSKEEIKISMMKDNLSLLILSINKSCKEYWKNKGIRFDEEMNPNEIMMISSNNERRIHNKIKNGEKCIPRFAVLMLIDQCEMANVLFGNLPLKDGKYSNKLNRITYIPYHPDVSKKEFYV